MIYLWNIEAKRDFTYVANTARGLIATWRPDIPDEETVNIGSGRVYTIKELVASIAELMGREDYEIPIDPRWLRRLDINAFHCDYSKLHEATGWDPTVDIHQGLRYTID